MTTYNLACFIPSMTDATSFYRGIGPLAELRRSFQGNLHLQMFSDVNWASLKLSDAVFMQRPFTDSHRKIVELAVRQNIPVWVDYDDYLLGVPKDNPTHEVYSTEKVQENIKVILALATQVTVSTENLRTYYQEYNQFITVIPNALDDCLLDILKKDTVESSKIVLWRGSNTHKADLNIIAESCISMSKKHPDWTFCFVGESPWFVDYMPASQVITSKALDILDYFEFIKEIKPGITLIPLVNNAFNNAKSNCAWLETTWSGSICVAPNMKEFERPGIINYYNGVHITEILDNLMDKFDADKSKLLALRHESWDYIKDNLLLTNVNKQRESLIKSFNPWE